MSYSDELGRAAVTKGPRLYAERISEYLTCSGVDALICSDDEGELFVVTVDAVDEEKAKKLIEKRRCGCENEKPSSPSFSAALKKLGEINDSSFFFVLCGGGAFFIGLSRVLGFAGSNDSHVFLTVIELILGFFFIVFGLRIFFKSYSAKKGLAAENAFTLKVIGWFLGTYSSADLDKMIFADENSAAPGEQRRFLIKKLINREFSIEDEEYLNYLTEEAYTAMYHTRKLAGRSR
ncbi:MAG: hypothetical protein IKR26_04795 [Lachnospiraceae bacterium]|nr:hypothetical protein [Lachnospiraceae bacterium]